MTQFQHTLKALLEGRKTETSRIVKPNEYTWICGERPAPWHVRDTVKLYSQVIAENPTDTSMRHRIVWEQGKDYAIVPRRGVKSVGRYTVEAIWRQDVLTLTLEQVAAEGFQSRGDFWFTWISMHDKSFLETFRYAHDMDYLREYGFYDRPAERYQAWRMTIKVLWDTVDWDAPAVRALQIEKPAL